MECDENFPVGETQVQLTVVDNTGDTVSDALIVTVLPRSALTETSRTDSINPNQGQTTDENTVIIDGAFLYRDSRVFVGTQEALSVEHVNLNRIICKAPGRTGTATVTVQSSVGTSNGVQYTYQESSNIPIRFLFDTWKNKDGSEYLIEEITSITIGRDHRYYMGSLLGHVTVTYVDRDLITQSACTGAFMGTDSSITDVGYNPIDPYARVFAVTNTYFHGSKDVRWDNAKIEAVDIGADGCPVRGPTIVSGLPVSNHDHGTNKLTFLADGRMLITVGSFTNAGVSKPDDGAGGVPENPLSASIVIVDYLSSGFNGNFEYDQYDDPATALIVSGNITVYAAGIRNSFGIIRHSNGNVYATDNGANTGFGATSITCTEEGPDPESGDKLLRIVQGAYYGHPNRNRERFDPRQCSYRSPSTPSNDGYTAPICEMSPSTNGIIEYRANTFNAELKGDLLMSKVAFGADGLLWRAELNENGTGVKSNPYEFFEQSGVFMVSF